MKTTAAFLFLALCLVSACKEKSSPLESPESSLSPYVGNYVVGRLLMDDGAGMDPIDFHIRIYEDRFEWISGTNVTVSRIASVLPFEDTGVSVTNIEGKRLDLRKLKDGISIRDDAAGKTLLCHKEERQKANKAVEDNGCSAFADCMFSDFVTVSLQATWRRQQPCLT